MKKRKLGKSGLMVSEIGLGRWQLGGDFGLLSSECAQQVLRAADQSGVDFWDTADVYSGGMSESRIEQYLSQSGRRITVATKAGVLRACTRGPTRRKKSGPISPAPR